MDIEVTVLRDEHKTALAEFIQQVWGDAESSARSAGSATENPYGRERVSPSVVALSEGRVIGHLTSTPCGVLCGGQERIGTWLSGIHVLPEARGHGVAKLLIRKMMEVNPVMIGVLVVEASRRGFRSCGWNFDWSIPEYVKLLDARGLLDRFTGAGLGNVPHVLQSVASRMGRRTRSVVGSFAGGLNFMYQGLLRLGRAAPDMAVATVGQFSIEVDALWERNVPYLKCAQARRSAYLNWRFPSEDGWIKTECRRGDAVVGYAVVSIRTLEAVGVQGVVAASVIDIFWDFQHPGAAAALLLNAECIGRERGAHIVLSSGTDSRARRAFLASGFIRIPGTAWYGYHSSDPAIAFPPASGDWYANRGDADAAGSLGPIP